MEITDAVALVTGGASGLGLATTKRLLDAGAQVVVLDLRGEEVVRELGDRAPERRRSQQRRDPRIALDGIGAETIPRFADCSVAGSRKGAAGDRQGQL